MTYWFRQWLDIFQRCLFVKPHQILLGLLRQLLQSVQLDLLLLKLHLLDQLGQ
jgi:hypothetical protein